MKNSTRSILTSVLCLGVTTSGFALTACDDDEVASGVVGAVIGAGVATAVNNNNSCSAGYRSVCSNYYDYYGRLYRDCRQVYDRCIRRGAFESASFLTPTAATESGRIDVRTRAAEQGLTTEDFAKEYWMGFASADAFFTALDKADVGDAAPLRQLGLSSEDIQQIGNYGDPSAAGIDALAKNLNQRPDMTSRMITRITTWALNEKTRICAKSYDSMNDDEKKLCNTSPRGH